MNASSNKTSLGQFGRIALFFAALVLATLLFLYRAGAASRMPLDQLARQSLLPDVALANGRPTIVEFYADWCEACRNMAPSILSVESQIDHKIDFVLLNVDNNRWQNLIDEYEVNGIPQLNFFDAKGNLSGKAIGVQSEERLKLVAKSLVDNEELPSFLGAGETSNMKNISYSKIDSNFPKSMANPRSHS